MKLFGKFRHYNDSFVLFFFLWVVISLFSSCSFFSSQEKKTRPLSGQRSLQQVSPFLSKKIVVLDFHNETPYQAEELGVLATEQLKKELHKTGKFTMVDLPMNFSRFVDLKKSQQIYASGGSILSDVLLGAQKSGIHYLLYGRLVYAKVNEKVDEVGFLKKAINWATVTLDVHLFDVHEKKEVFFDRYTANVDDQHYRFFVFDRASKKDFEKNLLRYTVEVAVRKTIPALFKISERLEWVGYVSKILGNKIYINAGRSSGLKLGDILKVLSPGEEIFDPVEGRSLGISKGKVKGSLEVVDFLGEEVSICLLHSGVHVLEGDLVQLYQ